MDPVAALPVRSRGACGHPLCDAGNVDAARTNMPVARILLVDDDADRRPAIETFEIA